MKFLLYRSRHGAEALVFHNLDNWKYLINLMEQDNGMSIEECRAEGLWVDGGTYEEGYVSVDEGGEIRTICLEDRLG